MDQIDSSLVYGPDRGVISKLKNVQYELMANLHTTHCPEYSE